MDIIALAALVKAGKNDVTISQSGLIELPLAVQPDVTFELGGGGETMTLVKVSDVAPTYNQWNGGVFIIDYQGQHLERPIDPEADTLADMSQWIGVPASSVGDTLVSIEQSTELVPSAGTYAPSEMIELGLVDALKAYYNGVISETITPHASYSGTSAMTAGETELPTNVLYMQTNSDGTAVKNAYLGVDGKAAKFELNPEIVNVVFTKDSGSAECSHTFDEIKSAYEAGKDVRFYYTESWTSGGGGSAKVELAINAYYNSTTLEHFEGCASIPYYDEVNQRIGLKGYVYCYILSTGTVNINADGISPVT